MFPFSFLLIILGLCMSKHSVLLTHVLVLVAVALLSI